jgi:hypothetical protein
MKLDLFWHLFLLSLGALAELAAALIPEQAPAAKHRVRLIAAGLFLALLVSVLITGKVL